MHMDNVICILMEIKSKNKFPSAVHRSYFLKNLDDKQLIYFTWP